MSDSATVDQIISYSVKSWNKTFGGVSSSDIASELGLENEEIMRILEELEISGRGKLNRNVELYIIQRDPENPKFELPSKTTTNHIYFPDTTDLERYYYQNLVREELPEYKARLHRGAHQLALVYFREEVLSRYFDHPEFYEVIDSNSGGSINTKADAPEGNYLYVRYGKRRQYNGEVSVTAIYKDLYVMSDAEQRYWHSHEIENFTAADKDPDFAKFVERTYEGSFVDFESPIKDVESSIANINSVFDDGPLFNRTENVYLRPPVENTRKALCDCCSELYKLVGSDSLNQKVLKQFLQYTLDVNNSEFAHADTGRPLSALQLLSLCEEKIHSGNELSSIIRKIWELRIEADHKLSEGKVFSENHVECFLALCRELSNSIDRFAESCGNIVKST